jgi:general nucleoside transport system permease protein
MRLQVEPRAQVPLSLKLLVSIVAGLAALLLVAIPVLLAR